MADRKEKLSGIIEEKTGEGLVQINVKWASDVMLEYNERMN